MSLLAQLSTAQAIISAEWEEIMWKTRARTAIVFATATWLCAIPVSIERSDNLRIRVKADTAQARIGRPGTPVSVAGVARRNARRGAYYGYYRPGIAAGAVATGAIAAGAGSYYGNRYGYPATYGYGYGYPASNPCLRQQRVWTGYTYQWQWVRTC